MYSIIIAFILFQKKLEDNRLYVFVNPEWPPVTVSWNSAIKVGIKEEVLGNIKRSLLKSKPSRRV